MKIFLVLKGVLVGVAISSLIYLSIIFILIEDAVEREIVIKEAYSIVNDCKRAYEANMEVIQVRENNVREVIMQLIPEDQEKIYKHIDFEKKRLKLKEGG